MTRAKQPVSDVISASWSRNSAACMFQLRLQCLFFLKQRMGSKSKWDLLCCDQKMFVCCFFFKPMNPQTHRSSLTNLGGEVRVMDAAIPNVITWKSCFLSNNLTFSLMGLSSCVQLCSLRMFEDDVDVWIDVEWFAAAGAASVGGSWPHRPGGLSNVQPAAAAAAVATSSLQLFSGHVVGSEQSCQRSSGVTS